MHSRKLILSKRVRDGIVRNGVIMLSVTFSEAYAGDFSVLIPGMLGGVALTSAHAKWASLGVQYWSLLPHHPVPVKQIALLLPCINLMHTFCELMPNNWPSCNQFRGYDWLKVT